MQTVFNAIQAAIAAGATTFTDAGLVAPKKVILFNGEYDNDDKDHVPPRPYLSVELEEVDWEIMDGKKEGDLGVVIHCVQDVVHFAEKQETLLGWPEKVVELLHELIIQGDSLIHSRSLPVTGASGYYVPKERFVVRVTRDA